MEDLISRQAVLDALLDYWHDIQFVDSSGYDVYEDCKAVIDELPPVTQKSETVTEFADRCRECGAKYGKLLKQEPKTGHWNEVFNDIEGEVRFYCSECNDYQMFTSRYCPNCGCAMVEPQESDHKCHNCKHYMSGEYDGSCDSYICEHYSGWESDNCN